MLTHRRTVTAILAAATVTATVAIGLGGPLTAGAATPPAAVVGGDSGVVVAHAAATPIHHVVVIFQKNVSFDHYLGTYPSAANTSGQSFAPAPSTPAVAGLAPATDPSLRQTRPDVHLSTWGRATPHRPGD